MRVNELSALTVTADLLEQDRRAALPTTVHWRLTCVETDTVLQDWTAVLYSTTIGDDDSVIEAEAVIDVPATLRDMRTDTKPLERKALTVSADKGLSTEYNEEMIYEVQRLHGRS